jgi:hypothetical protein
MHIEKSHHVDASEPDADGLYEWRYEYDLFHFSQAPLTLIARSYTSTPGTVHFLRLEWEDLRRGLKREDFSRPIVHDAVKYLRANGFHHIEWLTDAGYEAVPVAA